MTALQIGPFIIPLPYLIIIFSCACSFGILFFIYKDQKDRFKTISDLYINSTVITFLTWEFSPSLVKALSIINEPMTIFYQYGTRIHFFIGIAISIVYIFFSFERKGIPIRFIIDTFPFLYVGFAFTHHLLTPKPETIYQIPINLLLALIYLLVFVTLWRNRKEIGTLVPTYRFCFVIGLLSLISSIYKPQDIVFLGVSFFQILFISVLSVVLLKFRVKSVHERTP